MVIVSHDAGWLQAVDQRILFGQFPVKGHGVVLVIPPAVKPNAVYLTILCQQLGELGIHEAVVRLPIFLCTILARIDSRYAGRIIVARPVYMGVIQVESDALAVAFVSKLPHDVFSVGRIHNVEIRLLRVPHRESVMVARGETDVTRTSCLEG